MLFQTERMGRETQEACHQFIFHSQAGYTMTVGTRHNDTGDNSDMKQKRDCWLLMKSVKNNQEATVTRKELMFTREEQKVTNALNSFNTTGVTKSAGHSRTFYYS